jgi:hypothetical protein
VAPGQRSQADAVADPEPGRYAVICLVPDAAGAPYLAHGMAEAFEVTSDGAPAPGVGADVRAGLVDDAFDLPDTVPADAVLAVTNRSTAEAHEMVVERLPDGATVDDVLTALRAGSPSPGTPASGVQALLLGDTQQLQLALPPGRYLVICHVPGPDGAPHFAKGMVDVVTVT